MADPSRNKNVANHVRGQALPWGERRQVCVQVQGWAGKLMVLLASGLGHLFHGPSTR